jgi:hypothetical protein
METTAPLTQVDARVPADRPAPRRAERPVPQRSGAFDHLGLDALRDYRRTLTEEEDRVSYWRRIIQARLDVLRAGVTPTPDNELLRPVLAQAQAAARRTALVQVVPVDDIPPLPNLGELWERRVEPDDTGGLDALAADLSDAEQQLSQYRATLHARIAEATGELIARYREQPALCLSALPLGPDRRSIPA